VCAMTFDKAIRELDKGHKITRASVRLLKCSRFFIKSRDMAWKLVNDPEELLADDWVIYGSEEHLRYEHENNR